MTKVTYVINWMSQNCLGS